MMSSFRLFEAMIVITIKMPESYVEHLRGTYIQVIKQVIKQVLDPVLEVV